MLMHRILVLLLTGVLLSACAHSIKTDAPLEGVAGIETDRQWASDADYFTDSATSFADMPFWRYAAKVGLRSNSASEQANVVWRMSEQSNTVRLFGPLGAGAVSLEFDERGVKVSDKDGLVHTGDDAQDLLTRIIGWPLPIDALANWLFLHPDLNKPFQYLLNDQGQLLALRQFGWQIDYSDYRDYQGRILPRKLRAMKRFENSALGLVSVRLVTKSWQW